MADIAVEDAVKQAQQHEDAVRSASLDLDQDIVGIRETFSLPEDAEKWVYTLSSRLVARNREYRQRLKQDLRKSAHNLKHLYADGGVEDTGTTSKALGDLVTLIVEAIENNRRMNQHLQEFEGLHERLIAVGNLSLADRVFIRKSMPDLQRCRDRLAADERKVRDLFGTYKQSFYVIAFERELKRCESALSSRKATRHCVERDVQPILSCLTSLTHERAAIMRRGARLGVRHGIAWFSVPNEVIPLAVLEQELLKYEELSSEVMAQKDAHNGALRSLHELEITVVTSPATLPGPNGKEIPVDTLREAFAAYEQISVTCADMIQILAPILETLEDYLRVLREKDLAHRAFCD